MNEESVVGAELEFLPQPGAHGFASPRTLARHRMRGPFNLEGGVEAFSAALHQSVGARLLPGHTVRLLENREVFDVLVEEIRRAQDHVHILIYIWRPCEASDRLIEALAERAAAGVNVRVVVDPIGSEEVFGPNDFDRAIEPRLVEAGCEVHYYRLLSGGVFRRLLGREHQKIVVVDGQVGITGGFGIWKCWEGDGLSEGHWRDKHVRVDGPAVAQMQLAFTRAWQESGGALLSEEIFRAARREDDGSGARASFVASQGAEGLTDAERMCRLAFASAQKRLWIANAYFTPPKAMLEQLYEKLRRGVDVRILAPGPVHDVPIVRASQRSTYPKLLERGARIWEYQPSMMHAKTILVDDWLTVIGSTNLDALSLSKLGEGSLVTADRTLAAELEKSFLRDLSVSREIFPGAVGRARPWLRLARRATQLLGRDA